MTAPRRVTVGSRSSPLSLAQTEEVLRALRQLYPNTDFVVAAISTRGDRNKSAPLLSMGRGMFVREIEGSLLRGEIDFAVHSAKDLPSALPDGLTLAAFGPRQDPRDVLVDRWGLPYAKLPAGARIGTASPRRTAQLKAYRPEVEILPIRGNVGTRIEKSHGDDYDGVVLAAAGLARLRREGEISEYIPTEICIPDVGQGALAVEARVTDSDTLEMLAKVDHYPTSAAVTAERAFLQRVGGGCQVPVAAYAQLDGSQLRISAMAALPDGSQLYRSQMTCDARDPTSAGHTAAEALMKTQAAEIIARGPTH